MNKQELIGAIQSHFIRYEASGIRNSTVESILKALGEAINDELAKGGEVVLPGIGKFSINTRAARKGRNPSNGEAIDIAAKRIPKFSAAKAFKDAQAMID